MSLYSHSPTGPSQMHCQQEGVALLSVLFTVTIILLTLTTLFYRHQIDVSRASHIATYEQAVLLALSSESWWLQILREDLAKDDTDNLTEIWAFPSPVMPVERGRLSACVNDLQAKLNLNNLLRYSDELFSKEQQGKHSGPATQLQRMFAQLGVEDASARVTSLHDWLDADNQVKSQGGAEDQTYLLQTSARYTANQELAAFDELSSVSGFFVDEIPIFQPYFTALPKATRVNINTASKQVLAVLLNEFDEHALQEIVVYRPFATIDDFYQKLVDLEFASTSDEMLQELPRDLVSVSSEFFELNSMVELGDLRFIVQSLIYRPTSSAAGVLRRKMVPLPSLVDANGDAIPLPEYCVGPSVEDFFG